MNNVFCFYCTLKQIAFSYWVSFFVFVFCFFYSHFHSHRHIYTHIDSNAYIQLYGTNKINILIKKTKMKKTRREKDNNNKHRNEYKQRQRDIKRREREKKKLSENRLFFLQRCLYPLCLNKIPLAHKRIFGTTFSQSA